MDTVVRIALIVIAVPLVALVAVGSRAAGARTNLQERYGPD
jgi:hypothetical protein